jgi:transposase
MSARPNESPIPYESADGRTLLALIRHVGRTLDDLEHIRIITTNRRGAFERDFQIVLPPDEATAALLHAEGLAQRELIRLWRQHHLAPWAKSIRGVGEKSMARLIAEIGDPSDRPNVAKLWSYCGLNPERKRRKGMSQEDALACGNPRARKQLWLIATRMLMSGNRDIYDARREATAAREWTDGHKHNDALRIVAKEFVKQLWIASRHSTTEAQVHCAGGAS